MALALVGACGGESREAIGAGLASDTALGRDLEMAAQAPAFPPVDSISALEQGAGVATATGAVTSPSTRTSRRATASRTSSRSTASRSGSSGSSGARASSGRTGAVAPAPAERVVTEKNTKRDAAIGAVAGAAIGAATSRDKVKGAIIGAAAGGVIGGIIGNNVDVKKRRVPAGTTTP